MIPKPVLEYREDIKNYLEWLWINIHKIQDEESMMASFIHKSYAADFSKKVYDNERLEFLWDAILWAVVAKFLYINYPDYPESTLTLYKIALVREENLAEVSRDIYLQNMLFLGHWEEKTGGREKDAILADALEAIIGYIYIDLWIEEVEEFIMHFIYSKINNIEDVNIKSYKSVFQETVQKIYKEVPEYEDFDYEVDNKWNTITYKSVVYVQGENVWVWYWSSKKKSQEDAAKNAYEAFKKE